MKKLYTFIVLSFTSFALISQSIQLKNNDIRYNVKKAKQNFETSDILNSKVTPFWSDDLSDASLWLLFSVP